MLDEELGERIRLEASRLSMNVMPASRTTEFLRQVSQAFHIDENQIWWWEGLPDAKTVDYTEGTFLQMLEERVQAMRAEEVVLVATDDEAPPWLAVSGPWFNARKIVEALPFFEFFVVDPCLSSIVFDTHMNQLVFAGRVARET